MPQGSNREIQSVKHSIGQLSSFLQVSGIENIRMDNSRSLHEKKYMGKNLMFGIFKTIRTI